MATIRITNPSGLFLGSSSPAQFGTAGGTTLVTLADGVTGATGDGQYEVNLVQDELSVYGVGSHSLNLHVVKLTNGLPSSYDTRVLKICTVVIISGNVAGVRDIRVNGGVGANNVPPGSLPVSVLNPATFQLQNLTDVQVVDSTTTNGYILTWNTSLNKWIAAVAPSGPSSDDLQVVIAQQLFA